jgi:lipoprotein-anchoring transpeptidase ErfK/SrfK
MRRWGVAFGLTFLFIPSADADVLVQIDKSHQRMTVSVDGEELHSWPVSTGRAGYGTPNGTYQPQLLARRWFSRKYYNSPMPHSIFFHRGYAIHGSHEIRRLGGPASHGCVRLHPANAAALYALVQEHGKGDTRIEVTGANPASAVSARARPRRWHYAAPRYRFYWPRYYYVW